MNIAHFLTILRLIIIPLFPLFYLKYASFSIPIIWLPYILLAILIICEFTDLVDGVVARRRNEVTDLGKILDPMADSITRIIVLFTFTQGWISAPILLIFIFLYREFLITTLRTICAFGGFVLAARRSGKIKAFIQAIVNFFIVILMIPYTLGKLSLELLQSISFWAISIAALYSLFTAFDYLIANLKYLKKAIKKSDKP